MSPSKDFRLRAILAAVPEFDERTIRPAWSLYVALSAGVHPWPDANHRTASLSFDRAVRTGLGLKCALAAAAAADMSAETRRIRDAHGRYRIEELLDPAHPYRRVMARFEPRLIIESA